MVSRTASSLGLALLLVFGMVGAAPAQVEVAATQGILIRVDAPKANEWAAIGDTIRVRVLCYDRRLDAGFTVSVRDSSLGDGDESGADGDVHYTLNVPPNADSATPDDPRDNTLVLSASPPVVVSKGLGSGIDTFTVEIYVLSSTIETASNHAVKVVVDPTGDEGPLNNLMTDKKTAPAFSGFGARRVGDGVLFGVDGARPLHAGVFTSIALDLDELSTDTTFLGDVNKVKFKTDDEFKVTLNLNTAQILGARAERIEVGLVPTDSILALQETGRPFFGNEEGARAAAFRDDARLKLTLRGDRLFSPNPSAEMKIDAGQFADNQRLELFAYLVDAAGNVGGTATAPQAIDWKRLHGTDGVFVSNPADDLQIIADATAPTITINYPNPDSIASGAHRPRISRNTYNLFLDAGYIALPGEPFFTFSDGSRFAASAAKPLSFDVSEVPDSILITHGDQAHGIGSGFRSPTHESYPYLLDNGTIGREDDSTLVARLVSIFYSAEPGGVQEDLTIEVWDSLGNRSDLTLPDIWIDSYRPRILNLFPTGSGLTDRDGNDIAPTAPGNADNEDAPTVNLTTKNPVFQINEELDSLSIRYHEEGGGTAIVQAWGPGHVRLETVDKLGTWPVDDTAFVESQRYHLQIVAWDLAHNSRAADGGILTFTEGFANPDADSFKVVPDPDLEEKQVAGVDVDITLSVLDTTLTRLEREKDSAAGDVRAVTYHAQSAVAVIVSDDQAEALEGVSFSGAGVSDSLQVPFVLPAELAGAGMAFKAALLDGGSWRAGRRIVKFKSEKPLTGVVLYAAEGDYDPATDTYTLRISGQAAEPIDIEVAEFSTFTLTAIEDEISTGNVAGAFTVHVVPTDSFANPSLRIDNNTDSEDYESIAFTFASSNAAVTVPSGQQMVTGIEGATYGALASDVGGSATISVRTVAEDYETGTGDDAITGALEGSVTVSIVSGDGDGPDPGAPAAPANIVVQDYRGADGQGDQGGIVVISFPNSAQHEAVTHYRIEREVRVSRTTDEDGNLVDLEAPRMEWKDWARVSFSADAGDEMGDADGDMQTAIVPAIDNVATNWGVTAVTAVGESEVTTASKRVFTKESIRQTLRLLGMPEAELLTDEELSDRFNAPEDYVKSLIGDRKNVIFAPVNPDVSALVGSGNVPANIRTGHAGSFLSSARTVTEEPVAAIDDVAPAAVTDATGTGDGGVVLRWSASASEGVVGAIPYRGYNIPIPGVKGYAVMRGASADDLEQIATLDPGSTRFTDDNLPDGATTLVYRIDAFDDNNVAMSDLIRVENISVRMEFVDANGDPVYLIALPSQGGTLEVDFEDFVAFGAAFGSKKGDASYNPQADVNDDGAVNFSDFVAAAATFGKTAVLLSGSKLAVVPQRPGVNPDTEMTLELTGEKVLVGETISLTVSMANAKALNGYGLELVYDADKFEFVSAVPAENDVLKSEGGETPLFRNWPEAGRISVANAIIESGSVIGEGALATFTFKVLSEFVEVARFEIARGVVFDADKLQNPVVTLGALEVQSTPTEFALHQNYPNPFNPQTNIPYDLAEGGDVVLRIYNLLGQEVRTLVRERQAPGRYTVQWSGMDDRGVSVSSGIYFYRVTVAGKFQDARRFMLLK